MTSNTQRVTSGCAAALLVFALGTPRAADAEIIDRTLAVVGGEIILLSDANAAVKFGLIDDGSVSDEAGLRAALNALVDRQLQLFEVNRYLPPEPPASAIDARLDAVRARLGAAGFRAALAETGMTEAQVRSRLRDNLRIEGYRAQRFGAALQPTEEDLLRYYRANESMFTKDGVLQAFEAVRDAVRGQLVRDRSSALIAEWLDTLRRRTEIQILLLPRGFAPRTPQDALSRAAAPARSVRVARSRARSRRFVYEIASTSTRRSGSRVPGASRWA